LILFLLHFETVLLFCFHSGQNAMNIYMVSEQMVWIATDELSPSKASETVTDYLAFTPH